MRCGPLRIWSVHHSSEYPPGTPVVYVDDDGTVCYTTQRKRRLYYRGWICPGASTHEVAVIWKWRDFTKSDNEHKTVTPVGSSPPYGTYIDFECLTKSIIRNWCKNVPAVDIRSIMSAEQISAATVNYLLSLCPSVENG